MKKGTCRTAQGPNGATARQRTRQTAHVPNGVTTRQRKTPNGVPFAAHEVFNYWRRYNDDGCTDG